MPSWPNVLIILALYFPVDPEQRLARFRRVASNSASSLIPPASKTLPIHAVQTQQAALSLSDYDDSHSRPSSNSAPEKTIRSTGPRAGRHVAVARASLGGGLTGGAPAWARRGGESAVLEFTTGGLNQKLVRAHGTPLSQRSVGPPGLNPKTALQVNNFFFK